MKKLLIGITFTAALALALVATSADAYAASLSSRGTAWTDGRNKPTRPVPSIAPRITVDGAPQSLGISWE